MTKQILLGSMKEIDTDIQTVQPNQVVLFEGPGATRTRHVVYDITRDKWGYNYHLIDLEDYRFSQSDHFRPLSEKFGIGMYYDDAKPEFMTPEQVAELKARADERKAAEDKAEAEARAEYNRIKEIGEKRLREVMPENVQGVIVAKLNETEYTDPSYECSTTRSVRTVILGFSATPRNGFGELRKAAANLPETAHLSEYNRKYEHRYPGFSLGESTSYGWSVSKMTYCTREGFIDALAYAAGCEDGLQLKAPRPAATSTEPNAAPVEGVRVEIVDYSEKAIAVFGDTEPIKDILGSLFGRFNRRLSRGEEKCAGWVFPKTRAAAVREALNPYLAE